MVDLNLPQFVDIQKLKNCLKLFGCDFEQKGGAHLLYLLLY